VANASPEYEVCRNIAREQGVPLKRVMQEAMRAYAETERAATEKQVEKGR
jgi:uncharacterized protein (DUF111 family)